MLPPELWSGRMPGVRRAGAGGGTPQRAAAPSCRDVPTGKVATEAAPPELPQPLAVLSARLSPLLDGGGRPRSAASVDSDVLLADSPAAMEERGVERGDGRGSSSSRAIGRGVLRPPSASAARPRRTGVAHSGGGDSSGGGDGDGGGDVGGGSPRAVAPP